jgi:hypothetical protein
MTLLRFTIYGAAACAVVCCIAALAVVVWVSIYIALGFRNRRDLSVNPITKLKNR